MKQKLTFRYLFIGVVIILAILPLVTTFNSAITQIINHIGLYKTMQNTIVPFESKIVVLITRLFGIESFAGHPGERASFYLLKGKEYIPFEMQWNCLGWQSLLLLFISFLPGLNGRFTFSSKIQTILIGVLGTFLINILRMVFISLGLYYISSVFSLLIHDYFAAFVSIIWFFFFWWFSYGFVLEENDTSINSNVKSQKLL